MIRYKIDILEALKEIGINQGDIRKRKLFPQSTVTKFRNGDTNISMETLDTLCTLLQKSPSDIIEHYNYEMNEMERKIELKSDCNSYHMHEIRGKESEIKHALEKMIDEKYSIREEVLLFNLVKSAIRNSDTLAITENYRKIVECYASTDDFIIEIMIDFFDNFFSDFLENGYKTKRLFCCGEIASLLDDLFYLSLVKNDYETRVALLDVKHRYDIPNMITRTPDLTLD